MARLHFFILELQEEFECSVGKGSDVFLLTIQKYFESWLKVPCWIPLVFISVIFLFL